MNKNEALIQLKGLAERFGANIQQYTSNQYDEANTRVDFIDKFFELLGRDVSNNQGFSENYREVVREDKVKVSGNMKAPDYSFRLGGKRIFFVEAKKPSVDLKHSIEPAFQIRRYSWTAKLPLGILTDFEEFAVYDTRVKPDHEDKADNARIFYCKFDEYEKNRDFIYDTFSRDAILKGSFDRYITEGKKKGTSEVDKEFFKLITSRREDLAKNIYLRNKEIFETDIESLGFVVQNIIDKIIFLRIAEDREIEEYGKLQLQLKLEKIDTSIYHQLIEYFIYANGKYDSSLFEVSSLLKQIKVDDKILKDIINSLYYPESPYAFSVLGVDILGNIYEQFLGRDIVQKNGTIYIEEKPEVKKAGGVYYTPKYIVEYIVKNTVGELLKKAKVTEALKIKIVDPACGSGSFLIGAYTHLLDRYLEQYTKDKDIIKKSIRENKIFQFGQYHHLTLPAKIEILKNNIHGVDIDEKAVEVTKLSLLLKLMEGETRETSRMLISGRDAKILPNLEDNIKCGNSLIGSDYWRNKQEVPNPEEIKKINVFDREKGFEKIFQKGGFDVVIGNPPYIKEYTNREIFENIKKSDIGKYYEGKMDFRYLFACKGIDILRKGGLQSFIATNNRNTSAGASKLRKKLINETVIKRFIDFADFKVFNSASIGTMVYVIEKNKPQKEYKVKYTKIADNKLSIYELQTIINGYKNVDIDKKKYQQYEAEIDVEKFGKGPIFTFLNNQITEILKKIKSKQNFILNSNEVAQGIVMPQDYVNEGHLKELKKPNIKKGDGIFALSKDEFLKKGFSSIEKEHIKPFYRADQLCRYYWDKKYKNLIIYADTGLKNNIKDFPKIKQHLDQFTSIITSSNAPYGLHRPRIKDFFEGEKIMSGRTGFNVCFTYTEGPCYVCENHFVIKTNRINMKYLIGILNSRLSYFWLLNKGKTHGYKLQIDKEPLLQIPISYDSSKEKNLIVLVDQMLVAQTNLHQSDDQKKIYQQQIEIIDNKIDSLVFDLYGLSEEERRVVLAG